MKPSRFLATVALIATILPTQTSSESVIHDVPCGYRDQACACREDADVCKFFLTLDQYMTFTRYTKPTDPYSPRGMGMGRLYYIDNATGELLPRGVGKLNICGLDSNCTEPITVDSRTYRSVLVVNGQMPGPTLIVHEGQTVIVDVHNKLLSQSTTIHWHGMDQVNTPWMDGVGFVSQCPFRPGETFRYIFKAFPSGTFWYHAHMGTQRTDGIHGGLVIHERNLDYVIEFEDMPEQHTVTLLEWYRVPTNRIMSQISAGTGFFGNTNVGAVPTSSKDRYKSTVSFDGTEVGFIPFWSGLINGKGRHGDVPYHSSRLHIFEVERGKTYRFRLIGSQGLYAFMFSIDGHRLKVMATDGYLTQPVEVDYVSVHSGERYDVLVEANQTSQDSFWIRAETLEIDTSSGNKAPYASMGHLAEAVLHYSGSPAPTSVEYESIMAIARSCTAENKCKALNCPFQNFHESYHIDCIGVHELRLYKPTLPWAIPPLIPDDGQEYFFNFARHTSINGRNMIFPSVSPQTHPETLNEQTSLFCSPDEQCSDQTKCSCIHVADIPYGKTVRFILSAIGQHSKFNHPVHLHGHHFFVLSTGYGKYSDSNGFLTENSPDITCIPGGSENNPDVVVINSTSPSYSTSPTYSPLPESEYFCSNDISWTTPEPSFTLDAYTVRKDTVVVPAGGYVVIQFVSDNPGFWLMHCHIEAHLQTGMSLIVNEAQSRHNPAPEGMRSCGHFNWTLTEFNKL